MSVPRADVGVLGGSGFYTFVDDAEHHRVRSPFAGDPIDLTIGEIAGRRTAFLARHGTRHEFPPHKVQYRANIDVMRQLGVRALLAPFAAGSLRPNIHPGDFVVVDQFVDRTHSRDDTYYDSFLDGPAHTSLADPYDESLRRTLISTARELGATVHDRGTVVVIQGPRFSTRAESAWHRAMGGDLVNMTQCPEATLAREASVPYAGIAVVTDYDTGVNDREVEPVDQASVFEAFERSLTLLRAVLVAAIGRLEV